MKKLKDVTTDMLIMAKVNGLTICLESKLLGFSPQKGLFALVQDSNI